MKLLRYGEPGHELPGVLDDDGDIRSLRGIVADIDGPALAGGVLRDVIIADLPVVNGVTRLGPCVGKVGKFLCVGLNTPTALRTGATPPSTRAGAVQ